MSEKDMADIISAKKIEIEIEVYLHFEFIFHLFLFFPFGRKEIQQNQHLQSFHVSHCDPNRAVNQIK